VVGQNAEDGQGLTAPGNKSTIVLRLILGTFGAALREKGNGQCQRLWVYYVASNGHGRVGNKRHEKLPFRMTIRNRAGHGIAASNRIALFQRVFND
jgi:hypothetical protein